MCISDDFMTAENRETNTISNIILLSGKKMSTELNITAFNLFSQIFKVAMMLYVFSSNDAV